MPHQVAPCCISLPPRAPAGSLIDGSGALTPRAQLDFEVRRGPTCIGDRVYFVGPSGEVACFSARSDQPVWRRDLGWPVAAAGVAAGRTLILAGMTGGVIGLDPDTGATVGECVVSDQVLATPLRGRPDARGPGTRLAWPLSICSRGGSARRIQHRPSRVPWPRFLSATHCCSLTWRVAPSGLRRPRAVPPSAWRALKARPRAGPHASMVGSSLGSRSGRLVGVGPS